MPQIVINPVPSLNGAFDFVVIQTKKFPAGVLVAVSDVASYISDLLNGSSGKE